jgi:hypothetical protein
VAFWLRRGEIIAEGTSTAEFNAKTFERTLATLRTLTNETDCDVLQPAIQHACEIAGVVVAFVPEIPGTRVCGAARWLSPGKALIQLSLRHKTNDSLWFSFYHEAAHILKHSKKEVFIDETGTEQNEREQEANSFAENCLVDPKDLRRLMTTVPAGSVGRNDIVQFAQSIGIHPGIVLGRLQKERWIAYGKFDDMRVHYAWDR